MPSFDYCHHVKISAWECTHFTVEASSRKEADRIARSQTGYDVDGGQPGITIAATEQIDGTTWALSPEENNSLPTVQVFRDGSPKVLADNVKPIKKK